MIDFITNKIKCWILAILGIGVCFAAPIGMDIDNKTNPYEKIENRFEIQLPEQARIAVNENKPELYLGKWDDECFIKVGLPTQSNNKVKRKLFTNKLEWKDGNNKVHMYPIKNGFEYEVIFDEKPISNVVELGIETKGLKFYYQPPLTEEYQNGYREEFQKEIVVTETDVKDLESNVLVHRPENVVGSYAVYHESKAGDYSKMGLKNYRAGKAFHIFRPRIIDNAGTEVWGKLNITDNLLTVEIPQEFLDNAVYPVRHAAGLEFGYYNGGTPGGTAILTTFDYLIGSQHTAPANVGTADSISMYTAKYFNTAWNFKGVIVLHSNLNIITNGVGAGVAAVHQDWVTSTFGTSPDLTASTDYVLSAIGEGAGYWYYDDGVGTEQGHIDTTNDYGTPTNPTDATHEDRKYSIYCTYTAGGGAAEDKQDIFWFE